MNLSDSVAGAGSPFDYSTQSRELYSSNQSSIFPTTTTTTTNNNSTTPSTPFTPSTSATSSYFSTTHYHSSTSSLNLDNQTKAFNQEYKLPSQHVLQQFNQMQQQSQSQAHPQSQLQPQQSLTQKQSQPQLAPGSSRSRARAGTLPSRLPPGIVPLSSSSSSLLSTSESVSPSSSHLFTSSGPASSRIIQQSNSSSLLQQQQQAQQAQQAQHQQQQNYQSRLQAFGVNSQASSSASSLLLSNDHSDSYRTEIPFTTPSSNSGNTPSSISSSSPSSSSSSINPVSRLRSGSLNILSDSSRPPSIFPSLVSSIWSQRSPLPSSSPEVKISSTQPSSLYNSTEDMNLEERNSLLSRKPSQKSIRQSSPVRILDQMPNQSSSHMHSQNLDPQTIDPLQPFYKELTMRTDPSRMRSYTVNNLPYGLPSYDLMSASEPSSREQDNQQQSMHQYSQQQQQQQQQHQLHQQGQIQSQSEMPQMLQQSQHNSGIQSQVSNRQSFISGGHRPRAQTAASAFDPPLSIGNIPVLKTPQLQSQSSIVYSAQDPVTHHDIIVNTLDDASLGPSRSLWIGNIPGSTTSYALQAIFSSYGTVESARVLTHKNCGFVNFVNIESAVQAKEVLDGMEIFTGAGPCRVSFANFHSNGMDSDDKNEIEFPQLKPQPQNSQNISSTSPTSKNEELANNANVEYSVTDKENTIESSVLEPAKSLQEISEELVKIVSELGADTSEQTKISSAIKRALEFTDFKKDIGSVPEPRPDRVYDAPTLREVRKKIDSGSCSLEEIEDIALDILDEIAELSSDYVGNTVVQKLFDSCSEPIKDMMLKQIAPYLSQICIHKNGTWAAQRIIAVAGTTRQINTIIESLHPFTVHLFLDQFGNYAIQCVLKFGNPWNDFIFETMLSKFWEIAQGRFGARAMRACLESHYVSKEQQRMIAAAIAMHAVQLATNANGALLLTWFLDTYSAPNRHTILAPMLIPHIVQLGTHKLASVTVLKVVNCRSEPGARQAIFNTLFEPQEEAPNAVLEQILNHPYGSTFIFKILSTPFLEGQERQNAVNKIRTVLISIKALPSQGYKRLMDEVGLATKTTNSPNSGNINNNVNALNGNRGISSMGQNNNGINRGYQQYQIRGGPNQHRQRQGYNSNMPIQPPGINNYYQPSMMGPMQMMPQQQQPQQSPFNNNRPQYNTNPNGNTNNPQQPNSNLNNNPNKSLYGMGNDIMYSQYPYSSEMSGIMPAPGMPPQGSYDINMVQQQFGKMNMSMNNASMGNPPMQVMNGNSTANMMNGPSPNMNTVIPSGDRSSIGHGSYPGNGQQQGYGMMGMMNNDNGQQQSYMSDIRMNGLYPGQ